MSLLVTVPHITDDFGGHNFKRYNYSLMMAPKSVETCSRMCICCVHISVHVRLIC